MSSCSRVVDWKKKSFEKNEILFRHPQAPHLNKRNNFRFFSTFLWVKTNEDYSFQTSAIFFSVNGLPKKSTVLVCVSYASARFCWGSQFETCAIVIGGYLLLNSWKKLVWNRKWNRKKSFEINWIPDQIPLSWTKSIIHQLQSSSPKVFFYSLQNQVKISWSQN